MLDKKYYSDLLIAQYFSKPRARNTVAALVSTPEFVEIYRELEDVFDIDNATGDSLDKLGQLIGFSRVYNTNLTLTDSSYRTYLKFKIAKNFCDYTLSGIDAIMRILFGNSVVVRDYQTFSIGYIISNSVWTDEIDLINKEEGLLIYPAGVSRAKNIFTPDVPVVYYGFSSVSGVNSKVCGFNDVNNYQQDCPWFNRNSSQRVPIVVTVRYLLQENGRRILQENGEGIIIGQD